MADCKSELSWKGCYSGTFDLWSPGSYAHPAKLSPALGFRILEHLRELGLLKTGDTVLDPMGGIGTVAICAGAKGYKSVTVELEEKFCSFQKQNKDYAERKLYKPLDWQILQGDARRMSELLSERGLVKVSSPPYQTANTGGCGVQPLTTGKGTTRGRGFTSKGISNQEIYGTTEGQIDNLPDKPLKTVTSPPYEDSNAQAGWQYTGNKGGQFTTLLNKESYGNAKGQIGQEKAESYLEAMKVVYQEIAKCSDVLCVVVKNPTRNGRLRRLDSDTIAILEQSGWKLHCQHRSLLFEELEQSDLFGDTKKKVRGRMSFFKRLSWQQGNPVASWEDILICVQK